MKLLVGIAVLAISITAHADPHDMNECVSLAQQARIIVALNHGTKDEQDKAAYDAGHDCAIAVLNHDQAAFKRFSDHIDSECKSVGGCK
jgi:hypothetical protein